MSVSVEAPAWAVDLVERPALLEGGRVLTQVSAVRGQEVFTLHEPGRGRTGQEVVALPVTGESITAQTSEGEVRGYWLGMVLEAGCADRFEAFVLEGSVVRRVTFEPGQAEARQVVTGRATEGERVVMQALLTESCAHHQTWVTHQQRIDALVHDAHEYAENSDLCETFDDFMESHGMPRRSRDYELRVEVTATVYLTRSGGDVEDAIDSLTRQDVFDALGAEQIEYTAEEAC